MYAKLLKETMKLEEKLQSYQCKCGNSLRGDDQYEPKICPKCKSEMFKVGEELEGEVNEDGTFLVSPQPPTPTAPEIPEEDPTKKREQQNRTMPVNFGIAGI